MRSFTYSFSFLLIILVSIFYVSTVLSAPTQKENDNPYNKFIDSLLENNCTMPVKVKIPFTVSSDGSHFDYFLKPLKACQTNDALKQNEEAAFLCSEIFDVIRNITCFSGELHSEIDSGPLSTDVCNDYKAMKDILPKREDYLSGKLVDGIICKLLCTSDKYELLCKTLLWSYETQAKIKNAKENEVIKKDETVDETTNKGGATIKVKFTDDTTPSKKAFDNTKSDKSKSENLTPAGDENLQVVDGGNSDKPSSLNNMYPDEAYPDGQALDSKESGKAKNVNNSPTESGGTIHSDDKKEPESQPKVQDKTFSETKPSSKSDDATQIISNKITSSTSENRQEVTNPVNNANIKSPVPAEGESETVAQADATESGPSSKDIKSSESNKVPNQDSQDNPANQQENAIDDEKLKTVEPSKGNTQAVSTAKASGSMSNSKEISKGLTNDGLKSNANIDLSTKTNSKSEQPVSVANTEMDNELGNVDLQGQENESKVKQTDSKLPINKDEPKTKDLEAPVETAADADSEISESTTFQMLPDEDVGSHQEDKVSDQYDDPENEDYSKAEYESMNPPPKIQDPIAKSSNSAGSGPLSNSYEYRSTGNNIGRSSGDIPIPMISAFPEQEDGHFFFYFLSIVLILMAGYLIFHNKQKIIALIVEGRHERRRRSGPGYRKLETK